MDKTKVYIKVCNYTEYKQIKNLLAGNGETFDDELEEPYLIYPPAIFIQISYICFLPETKGWCWVRRDGIGRRLKKDKLITIEELEQLLNKE